MTIRKLLIANRGEIAVRIARTCRDMGIGSVAVFSDVDAGSPHVRACDEAIRLGGDTPATSYLRQDAIIAAAVRTGADAVHPGFGFLAENAVFARAVTDAGLVWVGPAPEVIRDMGDKLTAKAHMAAAGVPVLPSVAAGDLDDEGLLAAADGIGFPIMVKAAAGGGGTGMRAVETRDLLLESVAAARREAAGAFNDDRVFLERLVVRPRHVEVQIIGDSEQVLHLGTRDCSIQRRHQKVVEEAPAPDLAPELVAALQDAAVQAGTAINYTNAGTVEFIVDGRPDAEHPFAFLEVNTRLQVEHPVTELITGLDLVRLQLDVAGGRTLDMRQEDVRADGHAIEVRLYAENPAVDYLPATGTLEVFRPATGPGVRWDTGIVEGGVVSQWYDPMVAKVIAHGPTRDVAAARLSSALRRTLLLGLVTNRDLLLGILGDESFLAADVSTAFLTERFADPSTRFRVPSDDDAALAAVIAAVGERAAGPGATAVPMGFSNTGLGPDVSIVTVGGQRLEVAMLLGRDATVSVTAIPSVDEASGDEQGAPTPWPLQILSVDADGVTVEVDGRRVAATVARWRDDVQVVLADANVTVRVDPRFPEAVRVDEPGTTRAPMPGTVVTVEVAPGDQVMAGDLLAVVEAMKMEHRLVADVDGEVVEVAVTVGAQLDADDVVVVIQPTASGE